MELLLEERMVIEAIDNKANSAKEISLSTGLSEGLVNNILEEFLNTILIMKYTRRFAML